MHGITLAQIERTTQLIERSMLAPATHSSYNTGIRQFVALTTIHRVGLNTNGTTLPATEKALLSYIAWLTIRGIGSLEQYITHIRTFHKLNKLPHAQLQSPYITSYIKGAKNVLKAQGKLIHMRNRIPLRRTHIHAMCNKLNVKVTSQFRLIVALLVGNATLMRSGEFTVSNAQPFTPTHHVTRGNVAFHYQPDGSLHYATIHLPACKTLQAGRGIDITVPTLTNTPYCPAKALEAWLTTTTGEKSDHLFAINGQPYKKDEFSKELKQLATKIGLNPDHIGGHCIRIGGATDAKNAGCTNDQIKVLGRWVSDAYQLYTRYTPLDIMGIAARATGETPTPLSALDIITWGQRAIL